MKSFEHNLIIDWTPYEELYNMTYKKHLDLLIEITIEHQAHYLTTSLTTAMSEEYIKYVEMILQHMKNCELDDGR